MEKSLIYDHSLDEIKSILAEWGEPQFRADQIWNGLYKNLYQSPDEFTTLSKALRIKLGEFFSFSALTPGPILHSSDNHTQKILFSLPDSQAIETVLMKYDQRKTLCISTQAGCAMGCVFCATGQMGFRRNLTSGEILEQVLFFARQLKKDEDKVTNVVVMGMGEPFHNYEPTLEAIYRLNHSEGFNLGIRRFTVSTVGLIPVIERFTEERHQINLAISLHSTDDETRSAMMPINKKYNIQDLINACRKYVETTGRRITFEWALIDGVNDSESEARKLLGLLKGLICHVNLIRLNPTYGYEGRATPPQRAFQFSKILTEGGIPCTIRIRRGIDIQAGCGQLAIKSDIS